MLPIRPGTVWLMLYCSASRTRSAFRNDELAGYSGTTIPPATMGCGAYGPSVTGPGFGTAIGAGIGGNAARGDADCARPMIGAAVSSDAVNKNLPICLCINR